MRSVAQAAIVPVLAVACFVLILAGRADAQITVTVVMKSGEQHTGENPHLSESGEFGLRKKTGGEFRAKAADIAYIEFAAKTHTPPQLTPSEEAVVLRTGAIVKGELVEMAHLMHDDENSDYVVLFRDQARQSQRFLSTEIVRVYLASPPSR